MTRYFLLIRPIAAQAFEIFFNLFFGKLEMFQEGITVEADFCCLLDNLVHDVLQKNWTTTVVYYPFVLLFLQVLSLSFLDRGNLSRESYFLGHAFYRTAGNEDSTGREVFFGGRFPCPSPPIVLLTHILRILNDISMRFLLFFMAKLLVCIFFLKERLSRDFLADNRAFASLRVTPKPV